MFCDTLIDGVTDTLPAEARGIRATVFVTVPALALLDDARDDGRHGVATVEGVGPISMTRARELCGGADGWMRVLTHPETGIVLSVGRTRYRPPADLRRLVRWRAETCLGPGCNIPAARCEIDHTIAWEHGGDHLAHEPRPALQRPSHRETPRRLARGTDPRQRRRDPVDLPHRPAIPRRTPNAASPSSSPAAPTPPHRSNPARAAPRTGARAQFPPASPASMP